MNAHEVQRHAPTGSVRTFTVRTYGREVVLEKANVVQHAGGTTYVGYTNDHFNGLLALPHVDIVSVA